MVPGGGLEPPLCCQNRILNPARLPISPSRHRLAAQHVLQVLGGRDYNNANRLRKHKLVIDPENFLLT